MTQTRTAALIVAGGTGSRAAGDDVTPKQYRPLAGLPLLSHTVAAFLEAPDIDHVLVVIGADHADLYEALGLDHPKMLAPTRGGGTRQESVLAGLNALALQEVDAVLIHDAARPFVTGRLITDVLAALDDAEGALPVTLVTDTIKRSRDGKTVGGTEDRTQLFAAQTPQGFRFAAIYDAHRRAIVYSDSFTDDAAVAEWAGLTVALVQGDPRNIKITLPDDFSRGERILNEGNAMETRVGSGFDVHAFAEGDHVVLGGINIPHTARLSGHSDADVVLHALADALYGALAEGDIGQHFPPSDDRWKGTDSAIFLTHAVERVAVRGGRIVHCDVTVMCEAPKIGPHAEAMRQRIGEIAHLPVGRVAIKATTTEALGFLGRREGIAAHAVVTVALPMET